MANKKPPRDLNEIESRLYYLHGLKQPLIKKQRDYKRKYMQEQIETPDPYMSNFETNVVFSVIQTKLAEIASGLQEYDFIPMSSEAEHNKLIFKNIWEYVWITTRTDAAVLKAFESALKYGDGYIYEGTRTIVRDVYLPKSRKEGEPQDWYTEQRVDWDGIYTEYIPWENIYHDGDSIENANEVAWVKDWERTEYISQFEHNPDYKNVNESLPKGRYYYVATNSSNFGLSFAADTNTENIVTELRYYNRSKDSLIIVVNGVEVYRSHIPYKHKELPFCQAIDIPVDGRLHNMGEYELLEDDERYKNALRSLSIDVIKHQFGFTVVDPDADFDSGRVSTGPGAVERISPNDISFYAPNIGTASLAEAERKSDEDIIIKSGIDFRSQLLGPIETATKTQAKQASARKRINLMLKQNAYSFFERLARLRVSNIQVEFSSGNKKIFIKGGSIDSKGNFTPTNSGYGTFTVKPQHVEGEFNIVPVIDSILGISSEREKLRALEFMQTAGNLVKSDGTPVMNNEKAFVWLAKKFDVNAEEISGNSPINKTPDDIMRDLDNQDKGISNDPKDPNSPSFIPGAQQSGAKNNVPLQGSFAANQGM